MAKLTKSQLSRYRHFRERGMRQGEARRLAKLTTSQMAGEIRKLLNKKAEQTRTALNDRRAHGDSR